jgi:endonuclease/exonuclease/phosphatase family metal-dependent hydrolase
VPALSAGDGGPAATVAGRAELRVATFNIRHGVGSDGHLDLRRTAAEIRALGADVVGLQEVDDSFGPRSAYEDQAARLGELLGMETCFGAAIDRPPSSEGAPRRRYGPAMLTRGEIVSNESQLLPADPRFGPLLEPRALLTARIRLPGGAPGAEDDMLTVFVTHLDNDRREHRAAQVRRIIERSVHVRGPAVLLGDMNSDQACPELRQLALYGWRESAADISGRPAPSPLASLLWTALPLPWRIGRATFPARFPLRRIDGIWVRGPLRPRRLEVPRGRASDHRPVVVTLARP